MLTSITQSAKTLLECAGAFIFWAWLLKCVFLPMWQVRLWPRLGSLWLKVLGTLMYPPASAVFFPKPKEQESNNADNGADRPPKLQRSSAHDSRHGNEYSPSVLHVQRIHRIRGVDGSPIRGESVTLPYADELGG